jgi:hypothetical protein
MTSGTTTPLTDYPLNAAAFAVFALALLRYGLLAAIVASTIGQVFELGGVLDFSAWYAGLSFVPFALVLAVAAFGYRKAVRASGAARNE